MPKKEISTGLIKKCYFKQMEKLGKNHQSLYLSADSVRLPELKRFIDDITEAKRELSSLKEKFDFNSYNEALFTEKATRLMKLEKEAREEYVGEDILHLITEINDKIDKLKTIFTQKKQNIAEKFFSWEGDV